MKITKISAYRVELPLVAGNYNWSFGRSITSYDLTIVRIDTDAGISGWGEACQLGPAYLPAYAAGTRTGIAEVAPDLIGADPTETEHVYWRMDMALKGHPYVKTAIDNACWDILGKAAGLPVSVLLGGRYGSDLALYRSISQDTPDNMAKEVAEHRAIGFRAFQLKVGGDADDDIARIRRVAAETKPGERVVADANTGWLPHQAARVVRAVRDLDVAIEQPCLTYEECLTIRRRTDLPFILDECMDSVEMIVRGHADGAMDAVNIKIGRVGGLTRARQIRDLCVSLGIAVTIEDSGGGDITAATVGHLAQSTPEKYRFMVTSNYFKTELRTADGAPTLNNGRMATSTEPGLGVRIRMDVLGDPILEIS
jgi:L-alanine-DL-glutamate epimerase-like enolase superfamily enzyme